MSGSVSFLHKVDDHEADAGSSHSHKEKYQTLLQGAQALGLAATLLQIHFLHSGRAAPDCASSNNSPVYHRHKRGQGSSEL